LITIRAERSESLAVSPHQATTTSPEWIGIAEIPTTVCFPAIPNASNYRAEYEEASEGEPARAGFWGAEFVEWCFGSGEDSRRYRNRDNTTGGVAVVSDNPEHEDIQAQEKTYSCASVTSPVMADRPINGFEGTDTSFSVKQLLHSSPVDIKTNHWIRSS
jgi:hypothetical protein